jgi:hypothetical protein
MKCGSSFSHHLAVRVVGATGWSALLSLLHSSSFVTVHNVQTVQLYVYILHRVASVTKSGVGLEMQLFGIYLEFSESMVWLKAIVWVGEWLFPARLAVIQFLFSPFVSFTYNIGSKPFSLFISKIGFTI